MRLGPCCVLGRTVVVAAIACAAAELTAQQKAPVPDAGAQEEVRKAAGEIYGSRFKQAKTAAAKSTLAKEMLQAALKFRDGSVDQYVLLTITRDIATGAGDSETALGAVEKLAERFDVPAAKRKAEVLLKTARKASFSSQHKAVAEAALKVLDDLGTAEDYATALELCQSAQDSARRAKQHTLVKELAGRAENIAKRQKSFDEHRAARGVLEKDPADPAANLTAGRYLCFVKGDWDLGTSMLALGSDAELKALAVKDLEGANSPEEQIALGDGWWALAEARKGGEKESLRLRAGSWYQQAVPNLLPGLARVKVEKRLKDLAGVELPTLTRPRRRAAKPWDPAKVQLLRTLKGHRMEVRGVAFSPDGFLLASGSSDSTVRLWDVATGEARGTLDGGSEYVQSVRFSPRGSLVAAGKTNKIVTLWDVATGQAGSLRGHKHRVTSVDFNPDGSLLATGSWDNSVRVWEVATGRVRGVLNHPHRVESVAFSPDGSLLASACRDGKVRLWDAATGEVRGALDHGAGSLAFAPDGSLLASASADKVKIWSTATGELRHTLDHEATVNSVALSPDGKILASGSSDFTVRLWDPGTGRHLRKLVGHTRYVVCVAFSPDGRFMASGGSDKTIRLWGLPSESK